MADINDICKEMVSDVNDALGAAVVDLESGLLLGVAHSVPYFSQSYVDAVAAAAVDMFRGKTISTVERLLTNARGQELVNALEEVQTSTPQTYHFMKVMPNKPNCLLVLITGKKANLGMGWAKVRGAVPEVEPACP